MFGISKQLFYTLLTLTILITQGCSSREETFNFSLKTLEEARSFENGINSSLKIQDDFSPAKGFYPLDSLYKIKGRVVFVRNHENFLPLTTKYYKDENSDSIRYIIYEWNKAIPGTSQAERQELLNPEIQKFDDYHQKYIALVKKFKAEYGEPIEGDGKVRKSFTIYPIWKAHMKFQHDKKYIDLDWVWIPSNDARVFKIITKVYPSH